jgi:hypothetical protein
MLGALREGRLVEPRGLSTELLAWELALRREDVEPLLARAHGRGYVERAGLDTSGAVLWTLTDRGASVIGSGPDGPSARPRTSRRPGRPRQ